MTLAEQIEFLLPGLSSRKIPPAWPPDLFAICASLLHLSGGYCAASSGWPPRKTYLEEVTDVGEQWRGDFTKVPPAVKKLWTTVLGAKHQRVAELQQNSEVCRALLELLAMADEASMGVGISVDLEFQDGFDRQADFLLVTSHKEGASNLCWQVRRTCARVLPKMHVPPSGFTLRSFTHYLAFIPNSEIRPFWYNIGTSLVTDEPVEDNTFDILVLPWPISLDPSNFRSVRPSNAAMKDLNRKFGFFEFSHENDPDNVQKIFNTVMKIAAAKSDITIDAVVMPELSLSNDEYDHLSMLLLRVGIFLIAGVAGKRNSDATSQNTVRFNLPLGAYATAHDPAMMPSVQAKHHRWRLDQDQIERYGLSLPKSKILWEHISVRDRELSFVYLRDGVAICHLVCEDLARPDPVGDVIRAVGPNLVIALLLDGPQIETRWSARYATMLADDPGSSVLALTSKGMAKLGSRKTSTKLRSRKTKTRVHADSGKVALWKDIRGKPRIIDVGGGDAALLHVVIEYRKGFTIDGRDDGSTSGYPLLKSVQKFKSGRPLGRVIRYA